MQSLHESKFLGMCRCAFISSETVFLFENASSPYLPSKQLVGTCKAKKLIYDEPGSHVSIMWTVVRGESVRIIYIHGAVIFIRTYIHTYILDCSERYSTKTMELEDHLNIVVART